MAVAAFRSTTRKQYDIRGVEIEDPLGGRSINRSPSRRRSMSRQPSPTRRSMSKAPSPTRRRSMSKAPSPTRRRSVSKAPSPTRGRCGVSRNPSPTRRSLSKAPSPTRRLASRAASPAKIRRRSPSRNPSPTRGRRGMSRGPSPTRGRRGVSRGPSSTRGRRGVSRGASPTQVTRVTPATPARAQSRPASPTRIRDLSVGPRPRATSPQRLGTVRAVGRALRSLRSTADVALPHVQPDSPVDSDPPPVVMTLQSGIGIRGASRMHPSDSESEVEPHYARGLDRSGSFSTPRDSSDNESIQSSTSASKRNLNGLRERISRRTSSTQSELRRSLANLELSDASIPAYYQKPKTAGAEDHHLRNAATDDGDIQVEGRVVDKTIQEVHTQTKVQNLCYNSLYDVSASTDALSPMEPVKSKVAGNSREAPMQGDVDLVALYNARCAELWKVVSDTRNELKNVKEEGLRKVIEAKLKMSERKVSDLWSQYATEEQRCLHSVNAMKDTKQGSVDPLDMKTDSIQFQVPCPQEDSKPQHHHRYPVEDVDESDFIRQSLDEEAARYFEECAIIANFDANVIDVDDISVSYDRSSDGESSVCDDPRPLSRRQSSNSPEVVTVRKILIKPLDDEGMLLPWLDWEPEFDLGRKERIEKAICDFKEWKSAWDQKSEEWGKSSNRERGKEEGAVHVDEFLFERTRLQPRVSQGRMLVCGGKR